MAVKFNEYWNIIPDKMDEYIEFMQQSRIPTLNRLGINVVAMWTVLIGSSPQIISVGVAEDLQSCEEALQNKEYYAINNQLLHFVTGYHSKLLVSTSRFSHLPKGTEKGPVKFSQYWDIIPGKEKEYDKFIREVHYPGMEELDIKINGEWKVLIGESPNIFYEAMSDNEAKLVKALTTQKFRMLKHELLRLVSNYSSRVLTYHAFRSKSASSTDYEFYLV
ncbi:hypothetical protein H8E88_27810 [candidate division KSB1 bacterium]|nr:hypothetical protein [candidate division KSB1 bacterium]MBL7093113.1 hypothetical protein [candidate division KSB1 bacterium]